MIIVFLCQFYYSLYIKDIFGGITKHNDNNYNFIYFTINTFHKFCTYNFISINAICIMSIFIITEFIKINQIVDFSLRKTQHVVLL